MNKWLIYESEKRRIASLGLTSGKYEKAIRDLAKILNL